MNKLPLFYKGKSGGINFRRSTDRFSALFSYGCIAIVLTSFLLLMLRLFQLTIVKGAYYRRLSEENRIKELVIEAPRGTIEDRKGFAIAKNDPADTKKNDSYLASRRTYYDGEALGHIVGYRQVADPADFKDNQCLEKLASGDSVGKKGVEKLFDCDLRGKNGRKLVETDAKGDLLKALTVIPPESGRTIQLAIDAELQKKAYELVKGKKAAIAAVKPQTGEVLLLLSTPSFDPQNFEDKNADAVDRFLNSEDEPLFNRVIEGVYPPGSIFKLAVATAALEEKKIDEKTLVEDTGTIKAGPLMFGNWYFLQYGKTEGMVDVIKAIQRSNDIFFYKTGELLGPEAIKTWAERLGYGRKTGIGFEETEGTIPSPFWKEEVLKDRWYLGDTYNESIGQGYIAVTPLQATMVTTAIANNGDLCKPELLKIKDQRSKIKDCKKLALSQKTLNLIQEGMRRACSPGGTGWPLFEFSVISDQRLGRKPSITNHQSPITKIQTACKTGTAESHAQSKIPHAWFTVYAPYDKPEIALTVLVEEGGQGSDIAGPIARDILKAYFERSE